MDDDDTSTDREKNRTRTWMIRIAIGVVALIVVFYGAIFFYVNVISDSPDALDEGDLSAAVADTTGDASESDEPAEPAVETVDSAATGGAGADEGDDTSASPDGTWIPTNASEFGYRVEEVLAGVNNTAVGRSDDIEGTLEIAGSTAEVDITVQIENITSDDGRRDSQYRGRIMEADEFPEATFVSTEPIDFGVPPTDGGQVSAIVTGDLTLKGVTRTVTFEITAESNGDRIGVLGNIPVLFEDYGIDDPSFGAARTEDHGLLEFVLVFEPA
jgi:polyisoprenoid-binding protein YceI